MTRLELLAQCRFYKGEIICPLKKYPANWYWDMERVYVEHNGFFSGESATYVAHNFKDFDIPYNLLMVMFTSWAKTAFNLDEEIPQFYKLVEQYLTM